MSDPFDTIGRRPRVLVVGAGHGGLACVHALADAAVDVTLVDRNNYHKFQPLLYQVATAGLDVDDITQPIRHIVRGMDAVEVVLGLVTAADLERQTVTLDTGETLDWDALVLAPGASTAYYGVEGAFEHSYPMKNVADALALRSHVLSQFEAAARDPDAIDDGALTTVVVGGGPTGVEMTGALRELVGVLARDFPRLDTGRARVVLVDGERLPLGGYDPSLRQYTRDELERRGAEVQLGVHVAQVGPEGVTLADGRRIAARTVVWAAGVRANPLADALGLPQTHGARVAVDETLRVPGERRVFVVGDAAGARDPEGALYPQVAQVAIQQGRHVAGVLDALVSRDASGAADAPFRYRDLGQMATIGRNAAVLQTPGGLHLTGFVAWLGWLAVHVLKLVGFRNKVSVLWSWIYNYLTYDRGPRIILTAERGEGPAARPELATAPAETDGTDGGSHDADLARPPEHPAESEADPAGA